jgi:hypothetical protein
MKVRHIPVAFACALLLAASVPQAAVAQDDEPKPFVYGTYFQCDPGSSARASEIIRDSWGPIAQARIDSGELTAWGSLTHHTGGEWSRAIYHVAMDRAQLFSALDEMGAEWQANDPDAVAEFWDACEEHEDYVWTFVHGSGAAANVAEARPTAGMSTYWVCDEGRGALIDLLSEEVFAPAWNEQVEAGLIDSWAWYAHFIGDKYRRLLVANASSHADILTARDNVIEWVGDNESGLAGEFSNACNGHVDYLWNVEMSSP